MPTPMVGEYLLAEDGSILLNSLTGQPLEPTPGTVFSYPDSVPEFFHQYLPFGAAYLLLEEGDKADMAKALDFEKIFRDGISEMVAEEYKGRTQYDSFRPM
jgi:hypothetical protein